MNKWQEMAMSEGHFRGLPETRNQADLMGIEDRENAVFAALSSDPTPISKLVALTGLADQKVRVAINGLKAQRRVSIMPRVVASTVAMHYALPQVIAPEPMVDRYPNTVITERRSSSEGNGINARPMIAVRLPAPPWSWCDGAFSQPITAQTQEGRSTGRVGADT